MEKAYTVREVSKLTNLSETQIRNRARRKKIKGSKGSYLLTFNEKEVDELIKKTVYYPKNHNDKLIFQFIAENMDLPIRSIGEMLGISQEEVDRVLKYEFIVFESKMNKAK